MLACGAAPLSATRGYPETGLVLLSLKDGTQRASATVGTDVVAVIVSDDGKTAYVADSAPGDVYAVRLPGLQVAWKQHVGGAPFGLLLHGGRLFVSLFNGTSVVELDLSSGTKLATDPVPQGPAVMTTDGAGHVVVAGTRGQLTVIGGAQLAAGNGFGVAWAGGRLWSADYERAELVPAGDGHRVGMPVPLFPFWLAPGAGNTLLIAAEGGTEDTDPGGVFSFDTMTGAFTTLATPKDPDQVLQSGSTMFVAAHGDRDVLAIQGSRSEAWARGAAAVALAPDPALDLLVVAVNAHE
ncbi:MAG: YncE family protein [Candidatus Dormibacteraceae bacterium]